MINYSVVDENDHFDEIANNPSYDQRSNSSESTNKYDNVISSSSDSHKHNHHRQHSVIKVVYEEEEAVRIFVQFATNCKTNISFYADNHGPSVIINVHEIYEVFRLLKNRSVNIRLITEVTRHNLRYCNQIIKEFDAEIRHVDNIKGNFGIVDEQVYVASSVLEDSKSLNEIIYSDIKSIVQQNQFIFETLWQKSIPAQQRIREIEGGGVTYEHTKVIENPNQTKRLLIDLIKNAKEEILIVFSSSNAVKRQATMGIIDLLKQKGAENIQIKILSPTSKNKKELLLLSYFYDKNGINKNIIVKEITNQNNLKSSIVLIDQKYVLAIELKDDSKELFEAAIGLTTYSTSKPTLLSYTSVFEGLWNQTTISDSLSMANEKLIESEQIEREFINTAAHELRTPTQAITGYLEMDDEVYDDLFVNGENMNTKDLEAVLFTLHNHHKIISKNTLRLENLINNLLDVARIESRDTNNPISLDTERFDVVKEIKGLIKYQLNQKIKDKNIRINFANEIFDEPCLVYADRSRVNQIVTNLLDNAIKFSIKGSTIDIMLLGNNVKPNEKSKEMQKCFEKHQNQNPLDVEMVYIAISDSGKGISPDILPRLFEKFMTNSDTGTGLGLYISKKLVEAMGGKIWAFNNQDGVGSTFAFSLPIKDNSNQ